MCFLGVLLLWVISLSRVSWGWNEPNLTQPAALMKCSSGGHTFDGCNSGAASSISSVFSKCWMIVLYGTGWKCGLASCLLHNGQVSNNDLLSSFILSMWLGACMSFMNDCSLTTVSIFKGCDKVICMDEWLSDSVSLVSVAALLSWIELLQRIQMFPLPLPLKLTTILASTRKVSYLLLCMFLAAMSTMCSTISLQMLSILLDY